MSTAAGRIAASAAAVLAGLAAGCNPSPRAAPSPLDADREAAEAGYSPPPRIVASRDAPETSGRFGVRIEGLATPAARVRLEGADGRTYQSSAAESGAWSLTVPPSPTPRLFTLIAVHDGRAVAGEGRLLVLPRAPDFVLRPGYGALPLEAGSGPPRVLSVDVGPDGAAAVSGLARPSARVVARVDGAQPAATGLGQGTSDAQGRFTVILDRPLAPGARRLTLVASDGVAEAGVEVCEPASLGEAVFAAARTGAGWRLDWRLPGGGVQTTYVLDEVGRAG